MLKTFKHLCLLIMVVLLTINYTSAQTLKIKGEFPNENLKWPFIWDLKILSNQELICSTDEGQIFNKIGNTWNIISLPPVDKESIRGVIKDKEGSLWAATDGNGIFRYKDGQWQSFKKGSNGIPSDEWKCAAMDNSGSLWFGSWSDGVVKYSNGTWKVFSKSNSSSGLASNSVSGIYVDKANKVWVYDDGDITIINGNTTIKHDIENLDFPLSVDDMCQDKQGTYYLATNRGIVKSNGTTFVLEQQKFGRIEVGSIAVDTNNVLWYCEKFLGIHRYDNGKKDFFTSTTDNLIPSQAFKILIDSKNQKLLIGNKGSQVIFIDDSEFLSSTENVTNKGNEFSVYPNPTLGIVNIISVDSDDRLYDLVLINNLGEVIQKYFSVKSIDLTSSPSGLYLLHIIDTLNNKTKTTKVFRK